MAKDPYGEKKAAKKLGGKPQLNSGRPWYSKGDFVVGQDLFDRKETDANSFSITEPLWMKLVLDSIRMSKNPVLQIFFKKWGFPTTLVVMSEERYEELVRLAERGAQVTEGSTVGEVLHNKEERISGLLSALKQEKPRR